MPRARLTDRRAHAHRRQPQPPGRARAVDRRRQDRPHAERRLRAGRRGDPQGRAARERRAGRAVRGRARRGHAGAAALRLLALPARAGRARRARRSRARRSSTSATARRRSWPPAACRSPCAAASACAPWSTRPGTVSGPLAGGRAGRHGAGLPRRAAWCAPCPLVTARGGAEGGAAAPGVGASWCRSLMVAAGVGIWLAVRRRRARSRSRCGRPARAD